MNQRVAQLDVELVVVDVVQEHVDAAQVVGGGVDFLSVVHQVGVVPSDGLGELEQQRATATCRVIDRTNLMPIGSSQTRQEFTHLLRGEELAARLACTTGIHGHQKLIGIAEGIDLVVQKVLAQIHVANLQEHLRHVPVARLHIAAQKHAIYVEVAEEPLHVIFRRRADGRPLDSLEHLCQRHVQVLVLFAVLAHILEELGGKDEETLLRHHHVARLFCFLVTHGSIVKALHTCLCLQLVDVVSQILRNETIEQSAQHVCLKLPATSLTSQVVRHRPNGAMQFLTLLCIPHISLLL